MRAKTVKRLAILIAVFVMVGGAGFAVWKFQVAKMAQGVVEQADQALERREYGQAVDLYQQHLLVFPNDQEVKLKYADALLKLQSTPRNQETAMGIFEAILTQEPARHEVRRRAAELAFEMQGASLQVARGHLAILLKAAPEDGQLEFMMGRCYEEDKDLEGAAKYFRSAIEHGAAKRIDASQRLATLIRENPKLGKPEDADKIIDEMVEADPKNYRVHLERGRYLARFGLKDADAAFRKSLELDAEQPETYLELSRLAERGAVPEQDRRILDEHRPFTPLVPDGIDAARQILESGQEKLPYAALLYQARADLERKAGRLDRYTQILEAGIKKIPNVAPLHVTLGLIQAAQGDTDKLNRNIQEMRSIGVAPLILDYLTAYYHANSQEYEKAKEVLMPLQAMPGLPADWKARVNVLLAKVYNQLHEPELEWAAKQRAFVANPKDVSAHLAWISGHIERLVNRGELDEAIREYQQELERSPYLDRMALVRLLQRRNQLRPPAQRNWREVEVLLDDIAKASPDSVEVAVQRAKLYSEQDRRDKAWEELEAARSRFPEAVEPWSAEVGLLVQEKKFDEALKRLEAAQAALDGERIELRLARARIDLGRWAGKGAPEKEKAAVVEALNGLAKGLDSFPKEKSLGLLSFLAGELSSIGAVPDAQRVLTRMAEIDPANVGPHLRLFDLALQAATNADDEAQKDLKKKADIGGAARPLAAQEQGTSVEKLEAEIAAQSQSLATAQAELEEQIKAIEGIDPTLGRYCRTRYLMWQSGRSVVDLEKRKALRTEARAILVDLKARRDEWELIPFLQGLLLEQELAELEQELAEVASGDGDGGQRRAALAKERREKRESIITMFINAIDLGLRLPEVVKRTVNLMILTDRSLDAIQLLGRIPLAPQVGNELMQQAARVAGSQDDQHTEEIARKAEQLARKAVAARPDSLQDRVWLAKILVDSKRIDEAEVQLREAVAQAESDPDRWLYLVSHLIRTRQLPKAEQALRDAQRKLPPELPRTPLILAECCDQMGRSIAGAGAKKWNDEARAWYGKAIDASKDAKDNSVILQFVQFLLRTDPNAAGKQLDEVLRDGVGKHPATLIAWATRTRALMYIRSTPPQPGPALELIGAMGSRATDEPDDRRVRAQVLAMQRTQERRLEAIEILRSLVEDKRASLDDLFQLARIEEAAGDWPKARSRFRRLIELNAGSTSDAGRRDRQTYFVASFAERLLQPHEPAAERDRDLEEARQQIENLKQLQPGLMDALKLEVALKKVRDNSSGAADLIREAAKRPNLTPANLLDLALMAESIGKYDDFQLAEELYRKLAPPSVALGPEQALLVRFLARRRTYKDVLDYCEPRRKNAGDRKKYDLLCIEVLANPEIPFRPDQAESIDRLIGWLKAEIQNGENSMEYPLSVGNLYEKMERYPEAMEAYRSVFNRNGRDGRAANNYAWLLALRTNKWDEALTLINTAIRNNGEFREPEYLDTRAIVHLNLGHIDRAIEDLTEAIQAKPTASKYFHLAQAYHEKKDDLNARKNLEVAIAMGLPSGLHKLELPRYVKVRDELGIH